MLDELEKNLQISEGHMEPSRMTLYIFGNTFEQLAVVRTCVHTRERENEEEGFEYGKLHLGLDSSANSNRAAWKALRIMNLAKEKKSMDG